MKLFEPLPRNLLPKDLRDLPDLAAREIYVYRAVSRAPARLFVEDIEASLQQAGETATSVVFHLHDVVLYLAKIAGEGIIGNLAYAAVGKVSRAVRLPNKELPGGGKLRFETIISRKAYKRLRIERHPLTPPILEAPPTFEERAGKEYRLMVSLKRTSKKKHH
jgi:hypothetical protein